MKDLVLKFSRQAREKRAEMFRKYFSITEETKILDIGSEDGSNINFVLQNTKFRPENVYIADIDKRSVESGKAKYGFNAVCLDETGKLPFADEYFDIVYCSSVIEHATVAKEKVWNLKNSAEFKRLAQITQQKLADEIRRVGISYFVQTPNRNFIVESHSWLPLIAFFPRNLQVNTLKVSNRFWIKQTIPDFNLLVKKEMQKFFPDAEILTEKKLGMVKSIIAIKN